MGFLIQALYSLIAQFPGLAARAHRPCGRMGRRLQAAMGLAGVASMVCGALARTLAARGLVDGIFGYFPATLLGLVAVFLLASGSVAVARVIRNPAPATAENVIPFRRPIEAASQVHGPGVGPTGITSPHSRSLEAFSSCAEDFPGSPGFHRSRPLKD